MTFFFCHWVKQSLIKLRLSTSQNIWTNFPHIVLRNKTGIGKWWKLLASLAALSFSLQSHKTNNHSTVHCTEWTSDQWIQLFGSINTPQNNAVDICSVWPYTEKKRRQEDNPEDEEDRRMGPCGKENCQVKVWTAKRPNGARLTMETGWELLKENQSSLEG